MYIYMQELILYFALRKYLLKAVVVKEDVHAKHSDNKSIKWEILERVLEMPFDSNSFDLSSNGLKRGKKPCGIRISKGTEMNQVAIK
jgi:hypothetical protein